MASSSLSSIYSPSSSFKSEVKSIHKITSSQVSCSIHLPYKSRFHVQAVAREVDVVHKLKKENVGLDKNPNALWKRYVDWLYQHKELGLYLDISRVGFNDEFFQEMEPRLQKAFKDMEDLEKGAIANPDEGRMVGHYWLRSPHLAPNSFLRLQIENTLEAVCQFANDVVSGKIKTPSGGLFTQILSVGIGGSALGPQFVAEALAPDNPPLKIRFIDNTDPAGIDHQIAQLGPELASTLVIVISKSGGTPETRNGLLEVQKAFREAGLIFAKQGVAITQENSLLDNTARIEGWLARFPMFDWVGGRTSEMSAVGLLPAALQGIDIREMLAGAALMDEANRTTVVRDNPAALLALCWYWATDGVGSKDMVVLPYKDSLLLFSRYLQQLVMESLGKEFDLDGNRVNQGISVYGNKGSTDQHAYIQQLREGVHNFFATFIEVLRDRPPGHDWELEPGVTCGDYLFGMLQGTRSAPGVLACSAHVERGDAVAVSVAVEQSGPDGEWGIAMTRGTVLQGSQADPYYLEREGFYIGQATAMMSRAEMFRVSEGVAVDMKERVFRLPSFYDLLEDPQPGERILDMCAAPGGKTTAIASLMKDKGEVVAVDRSHNKVLGIQKLVAEMGLSCITTYKLDALKSVCRGAEFESVPSACSVEDVQNTRTTDLLSSGIDGFDAKLLSEKNFNDLQLKDGRYTSKAELRKRIRQLKNGPGRNHTAGGRVEKSKGFPSNSFDRVLLDAPCSALGLRPRLFAGEDTIYSLRSQAKYQRRMFDQAVQLVRPGGVIVYSTCTINPGENEALVRYALDTYEFLSLASQHPKIGGHGLTGSCQFPDGFVEEWLKPGEESLVQRFDPSSDLDTIGFFIVKFSVGLKN